MSEEYITLDGLCQQLSISRATGRNWLRLGKIESQGIDPAGQVYFTEEYVSNLKQSLETGERRSLRSRRNKRYVSGKGLYDRYVSDICESTDTVKSLVDKLERQNICVTEMVMRTLLADCALKLLVSSGEITVDREIFPAYIDGSLTIGVWSALIDDIIQDKKAALSWANNNKNLMDTNYYYQKGEDVLGLLYMSIRDAGSRKAAGSYYTPTKVFFGEDAESHIGEALKSRGVKKALLHYGGGSIKKIGLYDKVVSQLNEAGIPFVELGGVEPNPKIGLVRKGVELCRTEGVDFLLGVGGGSVSD